MIVQQRKYIKELLVTYSMEDSPTVSSPLPVDLKSLFKSQNYIQDATVYRQLVGKLIFLVHTRPDLSFTVQFLRQFYQNPCEEHYNAALHVLKYLKGIIDHGLLFNNN